MVRRLAAAQACRAASAVSVRAEPRTSVPIRNPSASAITPTSTTTPSGNVTTSAMGPG
ncbi:hypothetical protein [Leifsonia sp. WHRI 6310E]|uniref:hypothetical protein n=1 Tax=Leifsonia sp. WHRI 6310E TaxID=3162562 RepID=UPI0032F011EC